MQVSSPKKKRLTFWLVGLLAMAALGSVLWIFQDTWLPYWVSMIEPSIPADDIEQVVNESPAAADTTPSPSPASPAFVSLDFLSAAAWDHPQFHQGVRLFNQALDRYRLYQRNPQDMALLAQVANGTRQAGRLFQSLQPEAPASAPMDVPIARCRRLMAGVQKSRKTAMIAAKPKAAPAAPAVRMQAGELEQHPDYQNGARLFNKALDQFNQYKANPSRKELLQPTEDLARDAAQQFEGLKRLAPAKTHDELDRQIHQCYGIVSACRQQLLEAGSTKSSPFDRGTTGPSRRPGLPAYQPPQ